MKINKSLALTAAFALSTFSLLPSMAGGVTSYTGNVSTAGAGVVLGTGNNATAVVQLEFKVAKFAALGVYTTAGAIANPIFAAPATNFPGVGGTTFPVTAGILSAAEGTLASKFDLDGTTSTADQTTIVNAMNTTTDAASQDIIIKGAVFSNAIATAPLLVGLSTNSITLTGGTGSAPIYDFRAIAGVPGAATITSTAPATAMSLASRRNAGGYARFAYVGDLKETSVNLTTDGNWTGNVTITLSGL